MCGNMGGKSPRYGSSVWPGSGLLKSFARRFQVFRYGRYPMPNDDDEINRELLKHVMFKEMLNGQLHLASIGKNPQKIIDLGTGSGEWAIDGWSSSTCVS